MLLFSKHTTLVPKQSKSWKSISCTKLVTKNPARSNKLVLHLISTSKFQLLIFQVHCNFTSLLIGWLPWLILTHSTYRSSRSTMLKSTTKKTKCTKGEECQSSVLDDSKNPNGRILLDTYPITVGTNSPGWSVVYKIL